MITVLVADDHIFFQKSLQTMLEATGDIQVVATASNGLEAVAQVSRHCPDVVVMDISMPLMDGLEATRQIQKLCLYTRVVMLSILDQPEYVQRAISVGAVGYVLKEAIGKDLLAAIRALAKGKRYFSQKIAEIAEKYISRRHNDSWAG